ncbi:MAG: TlpA family protein disulfide reductase [Gammaproteobacteria bacterium]
MTRLPTRFSAVAVCLLWALSMSASAAPDAPAAQPLSASEFRAVLQKQQGEVLVVNFWATWCVPCLREVPDLLKLESEFGSRGVKLIGVAVDDPAPQAAQVEQFRRKYFPAFLTYARVGPEMDELASVIDPAWNEVVPTTYIIDRRGKAVARIQGKKSLDEFRAALENAL